MSGDGMTDRAWFVVRAAHVVHHVSFAARGSTHKLHRMWWIVRDSPRELRTWFVARAAHVIRRAQAIVRALSCEIELGLSCPVWPIFITTQPRTPRATRIESILT